MLFNKDWDRPHTNPVSEVLLKAADLIEQRGHTKHIRVDDKGSMCLLGAIAVAQGHDIGYSLGMRGGDTELTYEAAETIVNTLGIMVGLRDIRGIAVDWNNAPKRTAQEVIDVMRLAARTKVKENA